MGVHDPVDGDLCFLLCVDTQTVHRVCADGTEGYYPRAILLVPSVASIAIVLATQTYSDPSISDLTASPAHTNVTPAEGGVDWSANMQGIQNLMGAMYVAPISSA
jgi:hypothetical protein